MVKSFGENNVAGSQWLLTILLISILLFRVTPAKQQEPRFRHNRIAALHTPRHRIFSRYHQEDLMKHEYKTVEENVASRFKKLDKLLNSLPRPKLEAPTTLTSDLEGAMVSPSMWSVTTSNPLKTQGGDKEETLRDDFQVDELIVETPAKMPNVLAEEEWDNNIDSDTQWIVVPTETDLTTTTTTTTPATTTTKTTTTTLSSTSTSTMKTLAKVSNNSAGVNVPAKTEGVHQPHHHHQSVHIHKSAFTPRHKKVPLTQEEIKKRIEEKKSVAAHMEKMKKEGTCKTPRPKVIHIKDVYPHTSKTYLPHCTILHQCGTESGCCYDERHSCRAKTTKLVSLHFYTHEDFTQKIERLEFYNDTECECQPREDRPSNDAVSSVAPLQQALQQAPTPACVCPAKFAVRYLPDRTCMCDCFHLQKDCLKLKRGKDYFSREDQLCIKSGACLLPACEYGQYLRKSARCVRKQEMFSYWPKYSVQDVDS